MATANQAKKWYVRRGGKVKGPLAVDLIRRYVAAGQLRAEDEVSPDGERWRRIADIPAFSAGESRSAEALEQERAAEREALQWELQRRKAQQRAELRGRVQRQDGPRVRWWHYLLLALLIGGIGTLPFVIPEQEPVAEPQCGAPPEPGVVWRDCRLPGMQAANADLSGAVLRGANLAGSVFRAANLSGVDAAYANLSHSSLRAANLSRAQLTGTNLRNSDLAHANLRDADLTYANLSGADRGGADFTGARLGNAIWDEGVVCLPESLGDCIPGHPAR